MGTPNIYACYTVIAGNGTTEDGAVAVAHNEEVYDRAFVDVHKIPGDNYPGSEIILRNNGIVPQVARTFAMLWLEVPGVDFCDTYINENGVIITSNECRSREDKPVLTQGGIGFMLRRLIAERAVSARHAVEIAGELIEKYGYYSSGRTYALADNKEAWVLAAIQGKHWIAQRVPQDHVAVIANRYTIHQVNLEDKENFQGSSDIISYAIKRGWYNPKADGKFDFSRVYAAPDAYRQQTNILREWQGFSLLMKKKMELNDQAMPFSVKIKRRFSVSDLFQVLRDHFDNTEYEVSLNNEANGEKTGDKKVIPISSEYVKYSIVSWLRNDLPIEIGHLVWIAFDRPDTNAFSPWYVSLSEPPQGYNRGNSRFALKKHFKRPPSFLTPNPAYAFWSYHRLSLLVHRNYHLYRKISDKEWQNYENYLLKMQSKTEKELGYMVKKNKNIAQKLITNFVHRWEYRKWFLASELIDQLVK